MTVILSNYRAFNIELRMAIVKSALAVRRSRFFGQSDKLKPTD